jgi:hypothetical protein
VVPEFKMPAYETYKFDPELYKPKQSPEVEAYLKQLREGKLPPNLELDPDIQKLLQEARERKARQPLPVAPAPRPVEREQAIPDEK